jgi:hypothetical protein
MMNHPNITKVHDGGATETGRPYFVMELVREIKITDYWGIDSALVGSDTASARAPAKRQLTVVLSLR